MYNLGKITGVFMITALALLFMGGSYAMWSETLKINVTVNTGEVDVEWSAWSVSESDHGKPWVANTSVWVEKYDDEGDAIKLAVEMNDTYPCYWANITLIVDNVGTIPVKLYDHNISGVNTTALNVTLDIPTNTQIDPGENATYILRIHVLQNATEDTTYKFNVTLVFAQWNEVSGP
ncbi:MAG: hypothetical protein ACXQTB_03855 [Candidatus Nezhaarchaeales archaeon]